MSLKQFVLHAAKLTGLFAVSRRLTRGQLRILCYHGIWLGGAPHYGDCLFMDKATFSARLEMIKRLGYPVIGLDAAVSGLRDGSLPAAAVVITIDDAWHGTFTDMIPALERHGMPATLYVTTYYATHQKPVLNVLIGYMVQRAESLPSPTHLFPGEEIDGSAWPLRDRDGYAKALAAYLEAQPTLDSRWEMLESIAPAFGLDLERLVRDRCFHLMDEDALRECRHRGTDLQLHTHSHRMHDFEPDAVSRELRLNREHLSAMLERDCSDLRHFCYPSGVYSERVFGTLRQSGIVSATTTEFGLNGRDANVMALARILDCQSMSEIELEAKLCGFWSLMQSVRRFVDRSSTA